MWTPPVCRLWAELVRGLLLGPQPVHVALEVEPRYGRGPEGLREIYVPGTGGVQVPLAAFATVRQGQSPLSVNHQGQFPAATISFNLAPGVALSQAAEAIETARRDIGLPRDIRGAFAGTAQAYKDSLKNQPLLLLAALVTVYIVLGILYESTIHPLTILSTLPWGLEPWRPCWPSIWN